jgi:hypothetical protein
LSALAVAASVLALTTPACEGIQQDGVFSACAGAGAVHLVNRETSRTTTFEASKVLALRVSRLGRVAWTQSAVDGYELHRADAAGRDELLDSGPRVEPRSLTVRRAKLRWRNGSRVRLADFHGMRGDRPPVEDRHLRLVPGSGEPVGPGPILWRFGIEVEDGLPIDHQAFARDVERILFDERGWLGRGSEIALQRVDQPPFDFRVTLAKPRTTDRLCLPLHTGSRVSCENRGRSVINWLRWSTGSPYWGDRSRYRNYLIDHEVGHSLGHGHRFCGGRGQVAPIMQLPPCAVAEAVRAAPERRPARLAPVDGGDLYGHAPWPEGRCATSIRSDAAASSTACTPRSWGRASSGGSRAA